MTKLRLGWIAGLALLVAGCSDGKPKTAPVTDPVAETDSPDPAKPTKPDPAKPDPAKPDPAKPDPAKPDPAKPAQPAKPALPGADFITEARVLYRAVACEGESEVPAHLDAAVITKHCKRLAERKAKYIDKYATKAKAFLAELRPAGLPDVVVYPFGGGDLISALVAYPDAREVTTLSLEHAGDPRRIRAEFRGKSMTRKQLSDSLSAISVEIGGMLSVSNNTSKNLSSSHTNLLPAQLSSFLIGLAVHGYEPVSVRYFRVEDDGTLHYHTKEEIEAVDDKRAKRLKHDWEQPNFSPAFSNVEIQFRPRGEPSGPVRIHRHIAANLANRHLRSTPGVMAHLEAKGKVSAMTKAASYLLWRGDFSAVRDYLLANMAFMISDSTGIPPRFAKKAGFVQDTYGRFQSAFLEGASERFSEEFRELWEKQKYRRLRFRFGYVDSELRAHLLITRPAK